MSRQRLMAGVVVTMCAALAGGAAIAAGPFQAHVSSLRTISISGDVPVSEGAGRTGLMRARYVLPPSWQRRSGLGAATLRFDTYNSCRHQVVITARLVQAPDQPAADRAAVLTSAPTGVTVRSMGFRDGAAFRVVSPRAASSKVIGTLVQPLAARWAAPGATGQRVYAEIVATAVADPRRECHAGGPRGVAAALGDSFAAGHVGGFVHT